MLSHIVEPLELAIDWPSKTIKLIMAGAKSEHNLLIENAALRAHELMLAAKLNQYRDLASENKRLHQLLKSSDELNMHVLVADILSISLDSTLNQVTIDRGKVDHVFVGQPVLGAHGVIGQVVSVGRQLSRVLLLTDRSSAIPVMSQRTHQRSIVVGWQHHSPGTLKLITHASDFDVKVGDTYVASGLALHYPVGYPVARVTQIRTNSDTGQKDIILSPIAHLNLARQVILAWPKHVGLSQMLKPFSQQSLLSRPHASS